MKEIERINHVGLRVTDLEVTDLGSVQAQLEAMNYTVTEGPIVTPEGASFIFIRDPDDNVIEFHMPAAT